MKAWAMALGATATYVPAERYIANLFVTVAVFVAVNPPSMIVWLGGGVMLRRFLERPAVLQTFSIVMALLLVASLYPLFL